MSLNDEKVDGTKNAVSKPSKTKTVRFLPSPDLSERDSDLESFGSDGEEASDNDEDDEEDDASTVSDKSMKVQIQDYEDECKAILDSPLTGGEEEENRQFYERVHRVLENTSGEESLLHKLIRRLHMGKGHELIQLAERIVKVKPALLTESSSKEGKTPLHMALKECTHEEFQEKMGEVIIRMCNAASSSQTPDGKNYCQKAIECRIENLTCLHYAVFHKLKVLRYLVKKADAGTFTIHCHYEKSTVLHGALYGALHTGPGRTGKISPDVIERIIERNPDVLLEVNGGGLSPYRYFLNQKETKDELQKLRSQEVKDNMDRSKKRTENIATSSEGSRTIQKGTKDTLQTLRSQEDKNNMDRSKKKADDSRVKRKSDRGKQSGIARIEEMLTERCLNRGNFHNALKALYGNMEGKLNNQSTSFTTPHKHTHLALDREPRDLA